MFLCSRGGRGESGHAKEPRHGCNLGLLLAKLLVEPVHQLALVSGQGFIGNLASKELENIPFV